MSGPVGFRDAIERVLPEDFKPTVSKLDSTTFFGGFTAIVALVVATLFLYFRPKAPKGIPTLNGSWQKFKLIEKRNVSSNTSIYRLELPSRLHYLGLPIGQHIQVQAKIKDKMVQRSYTPISSDDDYGWFELMIKTYPEGNISGHMDRLKIGDLVEIKGPKGQMRYSPHYAVELGMMAGGTGITPMLQVIRAAMKNPLDNTHISLIYANVTEKDILLKEELDELAAKSGKRFKVNYVLDKPPENWSGYTGYISEEIIKERMPKNKVGNRIHLCGPPPMVNAIKKTLEKLEYEKANTVSKMPDQVFCY